MADHGQHSTIMYVFLAFDLSIDHCENVWYLVKQYGERAEWNVGTCIDNGPPVVKHS